MNQNTKLNNKIIFDVQSVLKFAIQINIQKNWEKQIN